MGRHFRQEIQFDRCWDLETQSIFDRRGEAVQDCILQNREELIGLCEFIEAHSIRSYLEIGIWTGRLISTLHRLFDFDVVAACDDGYARSFGLPIHLPESARFFEGNSECPGYRRWRATLGPVDLVFIDANHAYHAVKRDFDVNRRFPHRFIALHDISGATRYTRGVKRFWDEIAEGCKVEIVRPHREMNMGVTSMGIGIWAETPIDFGGCRGG